MKKFYEKCDLKSNSRLFLSILCKKESEEVCMLIWANLIVLLLHISYKQVAAKISFHVPAEVVLNSLQTQNGLELVSRSQFFYNFFIKCFFFVKFFQISLTDCVYFPSYSVKCISFFTFRHLMKS